MILVLVLALVLVLTLVLVLVLAFLLDVVTNPIANFLRSLYFNVLPEKNDCSTTLFAPLNKSESVTHYATEFSKFNPKITMTDNNCIMFSFEKTCDFIDCFVIYSPNNQLSDQCIIKSDPKSIHLSNDPPMYFNVVESQYRGMYYVRFNKYVLNLLHKSGNEIILQLKNPYQDDICIYYNAFYVESYLRKNIFDSNLLFYPFNRNDAQKEDHVWDIDKYHYEAFKDMHKHDETLFVDTFRWNKDYQMIRCTINYAIERITIENECDFNALELLMNQRNVFHSGRINLRSDLIKNIEFDFK